MALDLVNPHVTKILLAVEEGDSISHIARKTGSSYGWVHEWIERLEDAGVVERTDGVHVTDDEVQQAFENAAKVVLNRELELDDAYLVPNFAGMDYRYSRTDAVYVWTKGGYQIGRNRRDYPIFVDVLADDLDDWRRFFEEFSVEYVIEDRPSGENGIYFVLFPRAEFDSEWFENASVPPLAETVEWAKQFEANFQPALEMLDEMHDLGLDVTYRERKTI